MIAAAFQTRRAVALLTMSMLAVTAAACSGTPGGSEAAHDQPLVVSVHRVSVTDQPDVFEVGGTVQARTTAVLMSRIVAPVLEIAARPGDQVRAGQVLVTLDSRDLAASAARTNASADAARRSLEAASADEQGAQASLRLARATHERIAALAGKRSATPQELDDAAAALAVAEARVAAAAARALEAAAALESAQAAGEAATATESFTRIAAPFDGLVTEKRVETGNMAMPGVPLVVLEDTRSFRLDVRIDESKARDLATGVTVPVAIDHAPAADTLLQGTVVELSRAIDSGTHTTLAKIALPGRPWLRAGMFGRARFSGRPRAMLTVPPDAVMRRGQVTTVFTIEDDTARLRLVNLAGREVFEVLGGLAAGDLVIVSPPAGLTEGRRVRPGVR
jgi:RND family efflux transporter MFP subunit